MKASELIKKLEEAIKENGDLEVVLYVYEYESFPEDVTVNDDDTAPYTKNESIFDLYEELKDKELIYIS
jgi:hypothetical protein